MCGIVGKVYFNKERQVSEQKIKEMAKALTHRGPDDEGIFVDGNVGLGHRRLSIIDLSPAGRQPMPNEDKTIWLVFNGEIYNFKDLRKNLEKRGHRFRSRTDSECIIHLYENYGKNCLKYLRGMFAFAIWDSRKKELFLARDRIGKKPLKYYLDDKCFIFASELKAILKNPEVKKEPDLEAIDNYLTFQYVPYPWTGFVEIKKLPPAHYLLLKLTEQHRYQRISTENKKLLYADLTYKIRGAIFEVWQQLGPVFKEPVYQKALEKEFSKRNIPYESQKEIQINYNNEKIGAYRPDFIIDNKVILEIKKLPYLTKNEVYQTKYYLRGSKFDLALLANFGGKKLQIERYICDDKKNIAKNNPCNSVNSRVIPSIKIERYWKLDYSEKWDLSEKEWCQEILEKMEEAVKIRMISDVPLGAFLSGGIDSSAVVAFMSRSSPRPIKTFSIGFEESDYNELPYAARIAKLFKTEHQEFIVKPDAIEILPKLAHQYEEPYADSSAIPTWYLSELTKKYVTVALCGDGGDENFAGYKRYNIYKLLYNYQKFPAPFRKTLIKELGKIVIKILWHNNPRQEKALRFLEKLEESPEKRYLQLISYFDEEQKSNLWRFDLHRRSNLSKSYEILEKKFELSGIKDPLDRVLFVDFNSYLPDDLMVKVDIATMAHSLEGRSPLLDHEFLELTAKIPSALKLKNGFLRISNGVSLKSFREFPLGISDILWSIGGENKYIFKKALERILPKETLYRKKMGFRVPIGKWFQQELKQYIRDTLLAPDARIYKIWDGRRPTFNNGRCLTSHIEKLISDHQKGKTDYSNQLWTLLALEHWFRKWFD